MTLSPPEQQKLDAAIRRFPVLFAAARGYGVEHPSVQKRVSDQFNEIIAEYRRIKEEAE